MNYGNPHYGLTRTLNGASFADAVERITASLKTEGFGVLTEIDVQATLKKKLDVDFGRPYTILGACNPPIAHKAMTAEPGAGLLLPCNVVVTVDDAGDAIISAINALELFKVVGRPDVEHLAKEVTERLARAIEAA